MSLKNAAARVGASRQSSYVISKVLPVPPTDVCLSRSVRSGNNFLGRIYVSPLGCLVCQYYICVLAHVRLSVGPACFSIRVRYL